ncbi:methyltransferase domain-containing protein [Larkinella terrae]|uniref:Methyltransferase domain-containing protein n=1 Tax=Larkinella terrae TaxID=2025311 RepID=A0A7K0EUD4_9BACT|nr:methyltransferase domain-containing protein [Larkinella terrae]MRS65420.1 methyltransferase domain-containing protein [Larkinella terrae]
MAWNPDTYNKFKSERFAPFYDVLALIEIRENMDIIDLGCGTGELTRKLADALPHSRVLGIDSSQEMLNDSAPFASSQVQFEQKSIENQVRNVEQKWDLVFSNAAIQWVDDHEALLPKIISLLKPNGQLAIQLPAQHHNALNKMLNELADEEPFKTELQGWQRTPPVLEIEQYAQLLFENGGNEITVFEKIYPLVVSDSSALYDWASGTTLIPYTEKLNDENRHRFITDFKNRLQKQFSKSPVFYPFKRIIMKAVF